MVYLNWQLELPKYRCNVFCHKIYQLHKNITFTEFDKNTKLILVKHKF